MTGSSSSGDDTERPEFALAFEEIAAGSDRVCAIVGAALVEEELGDAIQKRLEALEKLYREDEDVENGDYLSEASRALKINSFLGSIDPKIRMAYLLGIIGQEGKSNLLAVASIRNQFAHRGHVRSFNDDRLKQLFKSVTLHRRGYTFLLGGTVPPLLENATRRQRFARTIWLLHVSIHFRLFEDTGIVHDPPTF